MKIQLSLVRRLLTLILAALAGCAGQVRYHDRDHDLQLELKPADAAVDLTE